MSSEPVKRFKYAGPVLGLIGLVLGVFVLLKFMAPEPVARFEPIGTQDVTPQERIAEQNITPSIVASDASSGTTPLVPEKAGAFVSSEEPHWTSTLNPSDYSQDMAENIGLEIGEAVFTAIDKIRLYYSARNEEGIVVTTNTRRHETDDGTLILYTVSGFADDSVSAEQLLIAFEGKASDSSLIAYGLRQKCYRSDKPDQWTMDLCP